MNKTRITAFQLYILILMSSLGTSSLFFIGSDAKQDAWMSVILASIVGILIFVLIYGSIFNFHPNISYERILEKTFGKYIGKFIGLLYIGYFIILATLIIRDVFNLLAIYLLPGTPKFVIITLLLLTVTYTLGKGLETFARSGEIYVFPILITYFVLVFLLLLSDVIKPDNLFPMLESGIKPVIKASIPHFLAFPFGKLALFMFIFPQVNKKNKVIKSGVFALMTSSFIITTYTVLNIMTIGVYLAQNSVFPTIETIRLINVGDFIQRLDAIASLVFIMGSLANLTLYLYVSNLTAQDIFGTKNYKVFIFPIAILAFIGSYLFGNNYTSFMEFGINIVPYYLNLPFEVIIPTLVLLILIVKYLFKGKRKTVSDADTV